MSLDTWKEEFYPTDAVEFYGSTDWLAGLNHAHTKWIGFRPECLERHDLTNIGAAILKDDDGERMYINGSTCALCSMAHVSNAPLDCSLCPLYRANGRISCDHNIIGDNAVCPNRMSPWAEFVRNKNPEPMINLIQKALGIYNEK